MSEWKFRKLEPAHIQGVCVACGINPQRPRGGGKFKSLCYSCGKLRDKYKVDLTVFHNSGKTIDDSCNICGGI